MDIFRIQISNIPVNQGYFNKMYRVKPLIELYYT